MHLGSHDPVAALLQPLRSMCLVAARTLVGLSLKDVYAYD